MVKLPALHICHGADDYRRRSRVRELLATWQSPDEWAFDQTRLSARANNLTQILTAVATPPLLSTVRVVFIENAEAADKTMLSSLVDEIVRTDPEGAHLRVLLDFADGKKPDATIASRAGICEVFAPPRYERDSEDWVREYARERHAITISAGAARALTRAVGWEHTGALAREVDKILQMTGGRLTEDDVLEATERQAAPSPFALYDRIGERNDPEARAILKLLLQQPDWPGIRILIGIATHLAKLGHARALIQAGIRPEEADNAFQGFYGRKLLQQARNWPLSELDYALSCLREADLILKTGGDEQHTLDLFLLRAVRTSD